MMQRRIVNRLLGLLAACMLVATPPAFALHDLTGQSINEAIVYGLENQDYGLSTFLGNNWKEGTDGSLLNIYTPFIELARSVTYRNIKTHDPGPVDVQNAKKKIVEDIDYVYHHPTVKFMINVYGDNQAFGKQYYARIRGAGKGREVVLMPKKSVQQYRADFDEHALHHPYSVVNAYHFDFNQVKNLDEFTFELYGKDVEPIQFKIVTADLM